MPRPRALARLVIASFAAAGLAASAAAALDPDRLAGLRARNIGPAGMSGRVTSVDVVVADPDTMWIGAATGGVWRSRDGGLTWQPRFDDQPVHSIGALTIDQRNPAVVWVGTGEGNLRNSVSVGNGVYRTRDGGETWQHLGLEKTERIHRILLDPRDPERAFACAIGQAWGENAERGVFRTTDGGRNWQKVLFVDERTGCGDLAMDPGNPDHLIAGMWQFRRWPWHMKSGGPGSGLHVSWDGGASWKRLQEEEGLPAGELGRIGVAFAPSDPQTVYALVEAKQSALLRSRDGGLTFETVNEEPNVSPRPFYFGDLRVDPATAERVYSVDYLLRASGDGGKSFAPLPGAGWEDIHGDYHALWIHPRDSSFMVAGNDGGVAISRDGGVTFRFVETLPLAQYYHVAVDMETPYNVYGGLQDNGSWRGPNEVWREGGIRNHEWDLVGDGDGFDVQPVPGDPTQGYSLWQGGNLMRWSLATGEKKGIKPAAPPGVALRFNWNAGLAVDPFEPHTVYLGSQFVHRSRDRGDTWETISPDLTTNDPRWQKQAASGGLTPDVTNAENFTTIVAIAPSTVERGVIWVGTDDGRVQVTRDGGVTWTALEGNLRGVPKNTWVPHIEASRHHGGTAYVVLDNHRRSDWTPYVYATTDYGRTWTRLASSVRGYALVVEEDPVDPDLLFLGTEFGLWMSNDRGREWTHLEHTLPTASVMDLAIHPRDHDLVIATHGRGLWVLDDVAPLRTLDAAALRAPLHFFPTSPVQQHWRDEQTGGFGFGAGEFRGANPEYGALLTLALDLPGLPLPDPDAERERREAVRRERRAAGEPDMSDEERPEAGPGGATEAAEDEPPAAEDEPAAELPGKPSGDSGGAKADGDVPEMEIVVRDGSGRTVRTFRAPAVRGVQRVAWNLGRDPGRALPTLQPAGDDDEEAPGPEVLPGDYTVTVRLEGREATQPVRVVADPRARTTAEGWQAREEATAAALALQDRVADAIWRVRLAREDVEHVAERARLRLRAGGERNTERIDADPVVTAAGKLAEELTALERTLWVSPETKGIPAETDVLSQLWYVGWYPQSSWDPPTATHRAHREAAEAAVAKVLAEVDRVFAARVEPFRAQAEAAGHGLLGTAGPVAAAPAAPSGNR
jgi:photosystem II stability/assembly factor-like uncharacterized protein